MTLTEKLFGDSDIVLVSDLIEKLYSEKSNSRDRKNWTREYDAISKYIEDETLERSSDNSYKYIPVWIDKSTKKEIANFTFGVTDDLRFRTDRNRIGGV